VITSRRLFLLELDVAVHLADVAHLDAEANSMEPQ
jgi:hypothetical protein